MPLRSSFRDRPPGAGALGLPLTIYPTWTSSTQRRSEELSLHAMEAARRTWLTALKSLNCVLKPSGLQRIHEHGLAKHIGGGTALQGSLIRGRHVSVCSTHGAQLRSIEKQGNNFLSLGINHSSLIDTLSALNLTSPTEIQSLAIPNILSRGDCVVAAETGSGKTITYLLPIIQTLLSRGSVTKSQFPRAIILVPSRELCLQVADVFQSLVCKHNERSPNTQLICRAVVGTEEFPAPFHTWTDVLITMASCLDLNLTPEIILNTQYLVLDEVDLILCAESAKQSRDILARFRKLHRGKGHSQRSKFMTPVAGSFLDVPNKCSFVFAGATIPTTGKKSAKGFIESFFPAATWCKAAQFHRHKSNLKQTFIEVGTFDFLWNIHLLGCRNRAHPLFSWLLCRNMSSFVSTTI